MSYDNVLESDGPILSIWNKGKISNEDYVKLWLMMRIGRFQWLIEALPRETGLGDLSQADKVSDIFHELVKKIFESIGIKYYPLRLYRDDLNSPNVEPAMHAKRAYSYGNEQIKAELAIAFPKLFPGIHHGVIMNVVIPSYHKPARRESNSNEEWDGGFEFLYLPK